MSYQNFLGYAGDILAVDAYALLKGDSTSVLIDVRTQAEWAYVGMPDIQALGKTPLLLEWQSYPSMAVDANFTSRLEALLHSEGVEHGAFSGDSVFGFDAIERADSGEDGGIAR